MRQVSEIKIQVPESFAFLKPTPTSNMIHLGNKHDGGYVISNKVLEKTRFLVSYGLGRDFSFEADFQKKVIGNLEVSVFDHSVRKPNLTILLFLLLFKKFRKKTTRYENYRKWLRGYNLFFKYNKHIRRKVVSSSNSKLEISAIESIPNNSDGKVFLKIDIEGGEYDVLTSLDSKINLLTGLAIEFHEISANFSKFKELIMRIKESHNLIYVHANNFSSVSELGMPEALEISFVRKDLDIDFVNIFSLSRKDFDYENSIRFPAYFLMFNI